MQEELKWFASFPKELEEFRGKHIALIGKKVVARGDNAIEGLEKAKKEIPKDNPVLAYVPREETLILAGD
jgi:hypothetical protein